MALETYQNSPILSFAQTVETVIQITLLKIPGYARDEQDISSHNPGHQPVKD